MLGRASVACYRAHFECWSRELDGGENRIELFRIMELLRLLGEDGVMPRLNPETKRMDAEVCFELSASSQGKQVKLEFGLKGRPIT